MSPLLAVLLSFLIFSITAAELAFAVVISRLIYTLRLGKLRAYLLHRFHIPSTRRSSLGSEQGRRSSSLCEASIRLPFISSI